MGLEKGLLGNTIRQARMERGISQERLAEMVGITTTHLKHIESEHRKPSIEVLFRMIEVLDFSVDSLFVKCEERETKQTYQNILLLLEKCDGKQLRIVRNVIKSLLDED